MKIVCLDLEGVLVPEMWLEFAEAANLPELKEKSTRNVACYDELMNWRLGILSQHNYKLQDVLDVVETLEPLPGAWEFYSWLKSQVRVIILSDTYDQFIWPLMKKLEYPTVFCHDLILDDTGVITGYKLRLDDQKRKAVQAFHQLNFEVICAGDSYNDLSMIKEADHGFFFRPPQSMVDEHPGFPVCNDHKELQEAIAKVL